MQEFHGIVIRTFRFLDGLGTAGFNALRGQSVGVFAREDAIRLLLLTGARRDEIASARWEHVDFQRGVLLLSDSKTGAKAVPLAAPALEILSNLPRNDRSP